MLRPESARKHAPAAPQFPRFFHKSDASLVMHCFHTVFHPFSLWSGPQYPVMHHFLGKCTAFEAPFAPSAAPPKDPPSAIEKTNRSPPQNLYKTGDVRATPPAPASQHSHMNASQKSDELSYTSGIASAASSHCRSTNHCPLAPNPCSAHLNSGTPPVIQGNCILLRQFPGSLPETHGRALPLPSHTPPLLSPSNPR